MSMDSELMIGQSLHVQLNQPFVYILLCSACGEICLCQKYAWNSKFVLPPGTAAGLFQEKH